MVKKGIMLFVCAILANAVMAAAPASSAAEPAGTAVLDQNSLWRCFSVNRWVLYRTADGRLVPENRPVWKKSEFKLPDGALSPLPPADWTGPAFDDGLWTRVRLPQPRMKPLGANPRPFNNNIYDTAMIAMRGAFEVTDPARVQACSLALTYWGGAVVYVNGTEVARAHAPGEKFGPETVAEDYAQEAFPPGQYGIKWPDGKGGDPVRDRSLPAVDIPVKLLRKGTNVVAVEIRSAAVPEKFLASRGFWPPVGALDARLTVSPPGAATASLHQSRPKGIQLWNVAPYETLTAFDYGAPTEPLRPIAVFAARNGVFSGRLAAGSAQPIRGLKVTVGDLAQAAGGAKIPSSAVRVRCAEPAVAGKSWLHAERFDGLFETVPAEIPVGNGGRAFDRHEGMPMIYFRKDAPKKLVPGAIASLWFTVRVPRDAKPGRYEGTVSVAAEGLAPTGVPLRVDVSDWTVPDPKDFRVTNFGQSAPDSLALHYGVPRWSDKHFELIGKSMALMAEVNSRQAIAELGLDFFSLGGNAETMIRWIKQPDGSFKHDFTVFDKFLDTVAKNIGKPHPLRLACWQEWRLLPNEAKWRWLNPANVSLLDPATGKLDRLEQPPADKPEFVSFWKPVLDEVRKKLEARGWFDDTTMQGNSYASGVSGPLVDALYKIWPDAVWSYTAHNGILGGKFTGTDKKVAMPVRYADTVWNVGRSYPRGYRELLKPRPGFWNFTYRESVRDNAELTDVRRVAEDEIMCGHDGFSDFGVDYFPVKKPNGGYYFVSNGAGTGGPSCSILALLAPGPDGPAVTERFEMFREGVQLAEAILFIQRAIEEKKIAGDLEARANRYLDERGEAFIKGWFGVRRMQAEHDEKLLALAGEVARALGGK